MPKNLENDRFRGVTVREAVKRAVWARSTQLTVSGYSPLEIATGRRPPDLLDVETSDPAQLSVEPLAEDRTQQDLQRLALKAHQEARQAADLRHDMAKRTMPSDDPYKPGLCLNVSCQCYCVKGLEERKVDQRYCYLTRRCYGQCSCDNSVMRVSQPKIRRDHDEWHDVAVPGLDNPDPLPLAVEDADGYEPDIAEYAEAYFGEQTHWFVKLASVTWLNSLVATLVLVGTCRE